MSPKVRKLKKVSGFWLSYFSGVRQGRKGNKNTPLDWDIKIRCRDVHELSITRLCFFFVFFFN